MSKTRTTDYVVIGAGSGGLLVAVGLVNMGKSVLVVSENIGGDCTHYGCVPSKTLLDLAQTYHEMSEGKKKLEFRDRVLELVRQKVNHFANEEKLLIPSGQFIHGRTRFIDRNKVEVKTKDGLEIVTFKKRAIVATGSSPNKLKVEGLDEGRIVTNEEFFYGDKLPSSVTIFGGGPIGAELATATAMIGIPTYLVSRTYLPNEPESVRDRSLRALKELGVMYYSARPVKMFDNRLLLSNGSEIEETQMYISAVGRRPNVDLGLEAAGIDYDNDGIKVTSSFVTTNMSVFAIGDCIGKPMFTHMAAQQAKFVLKKIVFPLARPPKSVVPRVTFTWPNVASVGNTKETAEVISLPLNFEKTDIGIIKSSRTAWGEAFVNLKTGRLVGASIVGEFAAELITSFTLIIDTKMPTLKLSQLITPYPTYANILHRLSVDYLLYIKENFRRRPISFAMQLIDYII